MSGIAIDGGASWSAVPAVVRACRARAPARALRVRAGSSSAGVRAARRARRSPWNARNTSRNM